MSYLAHNGSTFTGQSDRRMGDLGGPLWPSACIYFAQSDRVRLYSNAPVLDPEVGPPCLVLPDLGMVEIAVPDDELPHEGVVPLLAIVLPPAGRESEGVLAIPSMEPSQDVALDDVMHCLAEEFMDEVGPARALGIAKAIVGAHQIALDEDQSRVAVAATIVDC